MKLIAVTLVFWEASASGIKFGDSNLGVSGFLAIDRTEVQVDKECTIEFRPLLEFSALEKSALTAFQPKAGEVRCLDYSDSSGNVNDVEARVDVFKRGVDWYMELACTKPSSGDWAIYTFLTQESLMNVDLNKDSIEKLVGDINTRIRDPGSRLFEKRCAKLMFGSEDEHNSIGSIKSFASYIKCTPVKGESQRFHVSEFADLMPDLVNPDGSLILDYNQEKAREICAKILARDYPGKLTAMINEFLKKSGGKLSAVEESIANFLGLTPK